MNPTTVITATAVGVGVGLVDKNYLKHPSLHEQLLYRGGGLAASLYASHVGWGPTDAAPAATTSFAAHFAARAVSLLLLKLDPITQFGDVSNASGSGGGAEPGCGCGGG